MQSKHDDIKIIVNDEADELMEKHFKSFKIDIKIIWNQ